MSVTPQAPDASSENPGNTGNPDVRIPRQQGYGSIPPWLQQPAPQEQRNGVATAGFVVALVGAILALIPLLGVVSWVISPVGLVLSIVGASIAGRRGNVGRGLAVAGIVLGVVGLIICSIYAASFARAVSSSPAYSTPSVPSYSAPSYSAPSGSSSGSISESSGGSSAASADPNQFSDGTYEVGTGAGDIPAGRYKTTGANASATIQYCAVIREKTDGSIIDLDNSSGGPMVVTVKGSDGQVQFQGDCTWTKQ